jgi:hypothetical protein
MPYIRDPRTGKLIAVGPGYPDPRRQPGGGMPEHQSRAELLSRLPDADLSGMYGLGVVPGGENVSHSGIRGRVRDDVRVPTPTYRPLAGAQQNNRGGVQIVPIDAFNGQSAMAIPSVVETPKSGGDDGEMVTVQLGIDYSAGFPNVTIDLVAVVEWGLGGAAFRAEVDWGSGTCFSLSSSYVRISAQLGAVEAAGDTTPSQITLKAALSYGTPNSLGISSSARRSISVGTTLAAGAQSATFSVPLWAVGATLVDNSAQVPDYTVWFLETDPGRGAVYNVKGRTNAYSNVEGQFPIPAGSRFFHVKNNLLVAADYPQMIFNLSL